MKPLKKALLSLGFFAAGAMLASAHAFLDSSEPAVGSSIPDSPAVVKIWFTSQLANTGSDIEVFDAHGTEVDLKNHKVDSDNKFLMTVSLPTLSAGKYKVVWNAICRDSHHTTGTFTFNVTGP